MYETLYNITLEIMKGLSVLLIPIIIVLIIAISWYGWYSYLYEKLKSEEKKNV